MHKSDGLIFVVYVLIIIYDFIFNFSLKSLKTHWSNFYNGSDKESLFQVMLCQFFSEENLGKTY